MGCREGREYQHKVRKLAIMQNTDINDCEYKSKLNCNYELNNNSNNWAFCLANILILTLLNFSL